eukprot:5832037-Amphidinium_carterae.2
MVGRSSLQELRGSGDRTLQHHLNLHGHLQVEDLLDTGALIGISFLWSCNVLSPCEPSIVVPVNLRRDNWRLPDSPTNLPT